MEEAEEEEEEEVVVVGVCDSARLWVSCCVEPEAECHQVSL